MNLNRILSMPVSELYEHSDHLEHHGILGQKWGVRRFQNADGTLTELGKKRYSNAGADKKHVRVARFLLGNRQTNISQTAHSTDVSNKALKQLHNSKKGDKYGYMFNKGTTNGLVDVAFLIENGWSNKEIRQLVQTVDSMSKVERRLNSLDNLQSVYWFSNEWYHKNGHPTDTAMGDFFDDYYDAVDRIIKSEKNK